MSGAPSRKPRIDMRPAYDPKVHWPGGIGYKSGTKLEGNSGRRYEVQKDGSLRRVKS